MDAAAAMKQLVQDSEIAYGVIGRGSEFLLVPLVGAGGDDDGTWKSIAFAKGYSFRGVLAARNNVPSAALENPGDLDIMLAAGTAFAEILADRIRREREQAPDGWMAFITKLHSLEDPR